MYSKYCRCKELLGRNLKAHYHSCFWNHHGCFLCCMSNYKAGKCKLPDFWGLLQRAQDLLLGDAEDSVSFDSEGNFVFNRRLRGMQ